jgi:hypothetical protein
MGGEWSKRIGETGESRVKGLLDLLGWAPLITNYDIPCSFPTEHGTGEEKKHRREHGLDGSFKYLCPLVDATQQHVVVSVKYGADRYPTEGKLAKKFGEHYRSLSQMCTCYGKSIEYADLTTSDESATRFPIAGALFWLNHREEDDQASICPALVSSRPDAEPAPVFLVDNNQAAFLYDSTAFVRRHYQDSYAFNYQPTGKNLDSRNRRHSGDLLPLQMLNSPQIVFRVSKPEKMLIICSKNAFSESELKRLCDMAQVLTLGWSSRIIMAFLDYDSLRHLQTADKVKQMFSADDALRQLNVHSLQDNFRTEAPT